VAARRLIIIVLALLVVSSIAAALAPVRDSSDEPATTPEPTADEQPRSGFVRRTIDAATHEREAIAIKRGEQVELIVRAARTDQVEVVGLGEIEDVDPNAPARFDLLPREPGIYPVRMLDAGRTLGSIEVSPSAPGHEAERARKQRERDRDR
jgi:hypothetical protein